jgi:hypothetical protein
LTIGKTKGNQHGTRAVLKKKIFHRFLEVFWKTNFTILGRMTTSTKIDENLEGAENFIAWKYRVGLLLEEHNLEMFFEEEVPKQ